MTSHQQKTALEIIGRVGDLLFIVIILLLLALAFAPIAKYEVLIRMLVASIAIFLMAFFAYGIVEDIKLTNNQNLNS